VTIIMLHAPFASGDRTFCIYKKCMIFTEIKMVFFVKRLAIWFMSF